MAVRLIAMDMDGTLLADSSGLIPAENIRALREAAGRGIRLAIASGRFVTRSGLDMAVIGLNGGHILLSPGAETFATRLLQPDDAAKLFRIARGSGLLYALFATHTLWVSRPSLAYSPRWGTYLNDPASRVRVCWGEDAAEELIREGVHKLVIIAEEDMSPLPALRERIRQALPSLAVSSSWFNNIEINAPGVGKAGALRCLAEHYGIPMAEVMAIGDGENDCGMLSAAGYGVAMGNAAPEAVACAAYQTCGHTSFGVAAAIRALALDQPDPRVRALKNGGGAACTAH